MTAAWVRTTLGEIAEVVSGATPKTSVEEYWGGDVPWVTPKELSSIEGSSIQSTERTLTEAGLKSCAAALLPPQSVLLSSRAPIGLVAINDVPMATNQGFKSLVPHGNRVDTKFLYWWLRCHRARLEAMGNGATFKEVSKKVVDRVEIDLPPIAEQQRIAALLDAAETLRMSRRQTLSKLDALTRTIFLEMFGDPSSSGTGAARIPIGSVADVITGNTPSRSEHAYFGEHIEWLKTDNIRESGEIERAAESLSKLGRAKGREASAGASLVVCIAGSLRSIGRVGYLDRAAAFNQQINAVVPGPDLRAEFLFHQLRAAQRLVQLVSTNSMKGMVSKSALAAMEILVPPLRDQDEFVELTARVRRVRGLASRSLAVTDTLLESLQQRAFRGEL